MTHISQKDRQTQPPTNWPTNRQTKEPYINLLALNLPSYVLFILDVPLSCLYKRTTCTSQMNATCVLK